MFGIVNIPSSLSIMKSVGIILSIDFTSSVDLYKLIGCSVPAESTFTALTWNLAPAIGCPSNSSSFRISRLYLPFTLSFVILTLTVLFSTFVFSLIVYLSPWTTSIFWITYCLWPSISDTPITTFTTTFSALSL